MCVCARRGGQHLAAAEEIKQVRRSDKGLGRDLKETSREWASLPQVEGVRREDEDDVLFLRGR